MPSYAQTTFAEAKQQLANRLGDPTKVFWTDAELGLYIIEALRAWGLATEYWRDTVTLDTVIGEAFYDVPAYAVDSTGATILESSITDRTLINETLYSLMEPQVTNWAAPWPGTEMFSFSELADALSKSRDDMMRETALKSDATTRPVTAGQRRVPLATNTLHIRRAAIQEVGDAGRYPLWPLDQAQVQTTVEDSYIPAPARPSGYSLNYLSALNLDLWPTPLNDATLRLLVTQSYSKLDPTVAASILAVPNDAVHLLKYALMNEVLDGDGIERAPQMARYCDDRWQHGLDQLMDYHLVVWAELNGRRVPISSLAQREMVEPLWESVSGEPKTAACPNWNLLVLSPVPDAIYRLTLEVVRPAPIPASDGAYLQIGREHMSSIYNYAQHVAQFKLQGQEFAQSFPLFQSFLEDAALERSKRAAQGYTYEYLDRIRRTDAKWRPIWMPTVETAMATEAISKGAF